MVRTTLDTRLTALESKMRAQLAHLTPEEARELVARLRAEGHSEDEVHDRLVTADQNRFLANGCRPGEYSIYDNPLIRLPDAWAAEHRDPFVRLVGQLARGTLCVMTHQAEDYRLPLNVGEEWRDWDPLVLPHLALLSWSADPWRSYWAREDRGSLLDHYLDLARKKAAEFEEKHGVDATEETRQVFRDRIDWILGTEREPGEIPWHRAAAA